MFNKLNLFVTAGLISAMATLASAEVRMFQDFTELADGGELTVADAVDVGEFIALDSISVSGSGTLTASVVGDAADDFPFTALPIPAGTLTIGMNFAPSAAGERTATLQISENGVVGFSLLLNGTGAGSTVRAFQGVVELLDGGELTVADAVDVGNVVGLDSISVTGAGTLTAAVAGDAAADFPFTALPIPAGTLTIGMDFAPSAAGQRDATLEIREDGQVAFTIALQGTGIDVDVRMFQGQDEVFDNDLVTADPTEVGQTSPIQLTASGADGMQVEVDGDTADFPFTALPINGTLNIAMTFAPQTEGERAATLSIVDNGATVFSMELSGEGLAAEVDCNGNGVDDTEDIEADPTIDCDENGTPDACETDTDQDGVIDACDECPGEDDTTDDNDNGTPDCLEDNEITDCDLNGIDDTEDIADQTHEDCDDNGTPDVCQTDTDQDGVIDTCDECPGEDDTTDDDDNGTPDCLEENITDCNLNGVDDAQDLTNGSEDCNGNSVPDECELDSDNDGVINGCDQCPGDDDTLDGNANGTPDCLETGVALQQDCNGNGVEDAFDLVNGVSEDCNGNGVADECELDSDGDGTINGCDQCPGADDAEDLDGDGTPDCQQEDLGLCGAGSGTLVPLMLGLMCCGFGRRRRQ
jgi:hypothetical protein